MTAPETEETFNGVSNFLVRDSSINGYTRLAPRPARFRIQLARFKAMLTLWSAYAVIGLAIAAQAHA